MQHHEPVATSYRERFEEALDRAASIAGIDRTELTTRCRARVGHAMENDEFLLAAAEEVGSTVGILLNEGGLGDIAEEVRELWAIVRRLEEQRS